MRYLWAVFKAKAGIRGRILSIALTPSLALLVIGAIIAGLLLARGTDNKDWAARVDRDSAPGIEFTIQMQEERRLTLLVASGADQRRQDLIKQRARVDAAIGTLIAAGAAFTDIDPDLLSADVAKARTLVAQLPSIRQRADSGALPATEAYSYFNSVISVYIGSTELIARSAPTPDTSAELAAAARLLRMAETMSRGNALATAALAHGDISTDIRRQVAYDIGSYRSELAAISPHLPQDEHSSLEALTSSAAWQRLSRMEDAIVDHLDVAPATGSGSGSGSQSPESTLPLSISEWQDAATQVSVALLDFWRNHYRYALHWAQQDGDRALRQALLDGAAILLIALGASVIAARLSTRLIRRLVRLRQETLALADEHLPEMTARLREGRTVDTGSVARLDFGDDEIGQVAEAFNRAQAAAVSAAVAEAKTRTGVNAVFLNIAYRSQLIIHRQLDVLDKAERHQEDPTQLDLLFRLDHLATRARRNAENLIILGGGQPGRQWRTAVPLIDLIRSAVAETEHYQRVSVARVPDAWVVGNAVADLIHLMAELVDNATAFSPPESRVEITAHIVGKGIAVDITDQGLGMPENELELANETLRNPPDFSVSSLSEDSRLGLFVVARLAFRHHTTVRLTESSYGGIRAIVVLPTALISDESPVSAITPPATPTAAAPPAITAPTPGSRLDPSPQSTSFTSLWDSLPMPTRTGATPDIVEVPTPTTPPNPAAPAPDGRPPLPRRSRQASLAPELLNGPPGDRDPESDHGGKHRGPDRTAEQARNLMSAIEAGTRQGRQPISPSEPHWSNSSEQEGTL